MSCALLAKPNRNTAKSARPNGDHHSIAAPPPLPFPRHTLLDEAAAEIGIHQPPRRSLDRLAKAFVGNVLAAGEAREYYDRGRPALAAQLQTLRDRAEALLAAGKQEDALATRMKTLKGGTPEAKLQAATVDSAFQLYRAIEALRVP